MITNEAKRFQHIPLSVLDLAPVNEGSTPVQSFINSVDLAQHTEKWGFNRYWLAEHHNMPGIASSATSVIIGHIAEKTNHMRIGAGGVLWLSTVFTTFWFMPRVSFTNPKLYYPIYLITNEKA